MVIFTLRLATLYDRQAHPSQFPPQTASPTHAKTQAQAQHNKPTQIAGVCHLGHLDATQHTTCAQAPLGWQKSSSIDHGTTSSARLWLRRLVTTMLFPPLCH